MPWRRRTISREPGPSSGAASSPCRWRCAGRHRGRYGSRPGWRRSPRPDRRRARRLSPCSLTRSTGTPGRSALARRGLAGGHAPNRRPGGGSPTSTSGSGPGEPTGGVHPRPLRLLAELAREHPHFAHAPSRASRWTCRASARSAMPREEITIRALWRGPRRVLRGARVERAARHRELDGRLHRGRAGDRAPRGASTSSCWSPPPGSRTRRCAATRAERVARLIAPPRAAPRRARSRSPAAAAPARVRVVFRHPERIVPTLACELVLRRRQPGFLRALNDDRLRLPRPARRDEMPDADRLGQETTARAVADATSTSG